MRQAALILGTAVMYFAMAKASLLLAIPPGYATAVWPPSGLALAVLLLGGPKLWPGIWLGATAVNFTIAQSFAAAAAIGVGNTLEAVAGVQLARWLSSSERWPMARATEVFQLILVAAVAGAIAATVAMGALAATGAVQRAELAANWTTWWLGDFGGIMAITPLVLAWSRPVAERYRGMRIAEFALFALATALFAAMVFRNWIPGGERLPIGFAVLPLIVWAGARFGEREVTTVAVLMLGLAVWSTAAGGGPFAALPRNEALLLTQIAVGVLIVAGLALVATVQQLRRATEALRRAREETEQFVHVAAHDLQEPLRNIINFSELLEARQRDLLDARGREFLGYITSGAAQMRRLLDDLLDVSGAGQAAIRRERVDAGLVFDAVLRQLGAQVEEARAVVSRDSLPVVSADARLLERVFQNLLGNALKHRGSEAPRVHASARREGQAWVFSVADNGVGIDARYHKVVFDMFEQLPAAIGRGGTGAGLALCSKIVERHGGRIWVESAAMQGATFHFSLPIEQAADRG